ncbi:response regulator [Curtobacterium sp. S6]|uniref:response regulator n=1 Tax=Curtobacterium sp. S6 TaxID=1479623 RepID=UPI0004AAAF2B|nr:response regulator [Curtobacterium sp. S6]
MTLRVIVVDDEQVTASAHAEYIRTRPGFDVIGTAFNARGAIEAIRTSFARHEPVDLLLLDINLPDRSGHEVAKFLRAEGLPVDLLMVTADRRAASLRTASLHGAFGYLVKPFRLDDLGRKLSSYAQYRRRSGDAGELDQSDIDKLFHRAESTPSDLPKGLSEDTLKDMSRLLGASDAAYSAREISEHLGLSRVTARRYLEYLHEAGQVDRRARHGTPGRPELEYSWRG